MFSESFKSYGQVWENLALKRANNQCAADTIATWKNISTFSIDDF